MEENLFNRLVNEKTLHVNRSKKVSANYSAVMWTREKLIYIQ